MVFRMTSKTLGWNNPDSQGTERLGRGLQKEHTEKTKTVIFRKILFLVQPDDTLLAPGLNVEWAGYLLWN